MFKFFPGTIIDGQKVPLMKGWREAATTDQGQMKLWQELYRDRLKFFGVPCGDVNGIMVLDIDVKTNGWKTIQDNNFQIPDTLSQKTLNGGQHFIFKYNPNRDVGNRVGFLPGLDIRSQGGYIFWYGIDTDWSKPILDAPDWIFDTINKKKVNSVQVENAAIIKIAPEIAEAIFKASIDAIIEAPPGESNNTLNVEAFKVGQLVASGSISKEYAESELFKAAKLRGKPDYEARATIESGLKGGAKNPLLSPFSNAPPVASIEIPEPPGKPERWTPRYMTRQDLLNTSKLKKPQLFRDWSTEDIAITTADGGTGKTTLKLYEAICLALGDRFLGFENVQRGKTLYITGEDTEGKLAAMIGAILNQMGLLSSSAENEARIDTVLNSIVIKKDADLCLIAKDKQGFLTPNYEAMRKISEAIEDIKPKMIIFDPIASFWGSEAALNDMNKAVTKFMSSIVEKHSVCVEMINHMGKSSSASKDMSQFAGRGGSGLPSNSRVVRTFKALTQEEFREMTDTDLVGDQSAMLVQISKFSDGSPLLNKPFIVIRNGFLFSRVTLSQVKAREIEKSQSDNERIFTYIKEQRRKDKYPTRNVVVAYFMNNGDPMSEARIKRSLDSLEYTGHLGERLEQIVNPDVTRKDKVYIIVDIEGKEI